MQWAMDVIKSKIINTLYSCLIDIGVLKITFVFLCVTFITTMGWDQKIITSLFSQ
jgi:hypothetical protein